MRAVRTFPHHLGLTGAAISPQLLTNGVPADTHQQSSHNRGARQDALKLDCQGHPLVFMATPSARLWIGEESTCIRSILLRCQSEDATTLREGDMQSQQERRAWAAVEARTCIRAFRIRTP